MSYDKSLLPSIRVVLSETPNLTASEIVRKLRDYKTEGVEVETSRTAVNQVLYFAKGEFLKTEDAKPRWRLSGARDPERPSVEDTRDSQQSISDLI